MNLLYFSSCAIHEDGRTDPFLLQELPWLLKHFENVYMVSYYGTHRLTSEDGERISPRGGGLCGVRGALGALFSRDLWRGLKRLREAGHRSPVDALKLFAFAARGRKMQLWAKRLMKKLDPEQTTLYSCWMSFDGYAAALLKRQYPAARFVLRGHAFDIDVERIPLNPYLMKQEIADAADGVYLISQMALCQYMQYMEGYVDPDKVHVLAMGSAGEPVSHIQPPPLFSEGVLRVVSCAQVIDIKQVPLLAQALSGWTGGALHWLHIGGGEGLSALRSLCEELLDEKENVIWECVGELPAAEVRKLYEEKPFDVFVNTSKKEGVPVSIMEAMRCGVPCIAPAVGGIPELVTADVGFLYQPSEGVEGIQSALERFAALSERETLAMREAAKARWDVRYCSASLLPKLFPEAGKEERA